MKLSAQRFVSVTALLCIYTLMALQNFSLLTLAQEPAPFEISLTPQAEYAVSGQPFTYTIVVTNISQQALKDVFVKVRTPEGTVFVDTYFAQPNWFVGRVQGGQAGEIIWLTQEPVAPGEVVTFDLVVNVLPERAGQQLINEEYVVATIDNNQPIASGPSIKTQVLTPTPTPSPTAQVADTPTPTVTSSPTPQPQASSNLATSTPTPRASFTPASQADTTIASVATSAPAAVSQNTSSSSISTFAIIGLSGLILLIVGLVWFWKHR